MESYTFYFDESFHDRKIRVNENGQINTLLRYFSSYKDYEECKKIDRKLHSEYFNNLCCNELEHSYINFCRSSYTEGDEM